MKKLTYILLVFAFGLPIASCQVSKIDSLKQLIKTAKHDTIRMAVYISWGEEIYQNNPDSAVLLWKKTQTIAEKLLLSKPKVSVIKTVKEYLANSLNNIGYIYEDRGEISKTLEYYNKSLKLYEEIGDKKGITYSLNNIGNIYYNKGDIPKALEYYQKSLKIREEIGDKEGIATSLNNIGSIFNTQFDFPKALEYYGKSLKIYKEIGAKQGIAYALNNIDGIYGDQGNKHQKLEYNNKSLKLREQI